MKNTRQSDNASPVNINIDILPKKYSARRGSDIPIKQPTLDEYMKKYENSPKAADTPIKYNMSVPPSNKTL